MTTMLRISDSKSGKGPQSLDQALVDAIQQTVAYADIFDYPLTPDEIHRYLIGLAISRESVVAALDIMTSPEGPLRRQGDFVMLRGRESLESVRREREKRAVRFWSRGLRFGRLIASLPFVRMVAVTGELAMNNVREGSDIDYFIITEHRRLWLCRLMVVAIVKMAKLSGFVVCPNFLLSERVLALSEHDLYTAHEVAQMIPISGPEIYAQFRKANRWIYDFLPNVTGAPRDIRTRPQARPVRALVESALRTRAGAALEGWESQRKLRKFRDVSLEHAEASFSTDWCKGHVHDHGRLILAAFSAHSGDVEGSTS